MKGQKGKVKDFHCPLSDEAQKVIAKLNARARDGWLFPTVSKLSKTGHMSNSTMSKYMRVERGLHCVPHGFRTSMRTWIEEVPKSRWQVAESTLLILSVIRSLRNARYKLVARAPTSSSSGQILLRVKSMDKDKSQGTLRSYSGAKVSYMCTAMGLTRCRLRDNLGYNLLISPWREDLIKKPN